MRDFFRLILVGTLLGGLSFGQETKELTVAHSLAPDAEVSAYKVISARAGKPGEFLLFERGGKVRQYRVAKTGGFQEFSGDLILPSADRTLISVTEDEGKLILFALNPKGLYSYGRNDQGQFVGPGKRLLRRANFRIRVGGPRLANILQDVNGDSVLDLVAPERDFCEVWLSEKGKFRKAAKVSVRVSIDQSVGAASGDDRFFQTIGIPDLDVRDMNGDKRNDVVIMRGSQTRIHRQKEDGSIPFEPDVILELDKFKDTSPKATIRPGRTLAGSDKTRLLIRDLDQDGIPDYVISHRRKVWTFHGTLDGPQFIRPTKILKTSDDITFIWLANLGQDKYTDLIVARVEVPTVGTLITGLFGTIDIGMRVLGYESQGGKVFANKPTFKNDLTFILPSLGEIMRNPEALIQRFEEAASTFRESIYADVNGDKRGDLVLLDENTTKAEIWQRGPQDQQAQEENLDAVVREMFFDEKDAQWDLDRMFNWIENLGNARATRWTKGRAADRVIPFRKDKLHLPLHILHGDLNGDGKEELLVVYRVLGKKAARRFDLIGWN